MPSEAFYTTRVDSAVRLHTAVHPPESEEEPLTVHELFVRSLSRDGASDLTALGATLLNCLKRAYGSAINRDIFVCKITIIISSIIIGITN